MILHHVVGYTPEERILMSNQLIRASSRYTHKKQSKDGNLRIIQRELVSPRPLQQSLQENCDLASAKTTIRGQKLTLTLV